MNFPYPLARSVPEDSWDPPRILVLSSSPLEVRDDAACRFVFTPENGFDGILVFDVRGAEAVETIIHQSKAYLLPVANLSGVPLPFADFQADERTTETVDAAIEELSRIAGLIGTLPEDTRSSKVPETILLARAYSRERVIEPAYDPSVRDCIIYPVAGLVENPGRRAERMTNAGYFTRMFFDRLHACPDCGSSRLNAREECIACRSADLTDESQLHHLRCGHRGLETEFRHHNLLICPECGDELRLEGVDYDKPGQANACRCCGHIASQASVGFVCIDCKARHDSEAIATRDFYKYELTRKGERALLTSEPWDRPDRSAAGPSVQEAVIRQALRVHSRYGRPLAILKVTFGGENTLRDSGAAVSMTQASVKVGAILRSETRETDVVMETDYGFIVYMPETPDDDVDCPKTRLRGRIGAILPADLDVQITDLRPDELKPAMAASF